ncbi:beta-ketoacyl-ACP synthase II, partial [Rhizobium ruizarguesonis]
VGYGLSGDAYHITAPSEDGECAGLCMAMALKRAGLTPADIDYINSHGTSTMADTIELGAVERLVGNSASKTWRSSTP